MGLKVVKCSDEAYAEICRVASENKTYLSDAVDIIVFRKEKKDEHKRAKSRAKGGTAKRDKRTGNPPKTGLPSPVREIVEGVEDLFAD